MNPPALSLIGAESRAGIFIAAQVLIEPLNHQYWIGTVRKSYLPNKTFLHPSRVMVKVSVHFRFPQIAVYR